MAAFKDGGIQFTQVNDTPNIDEVDCFSFYLENGHLKLIGDSLNETIAFISDVSVSGGGGGGVTNPNGQITAISGSAIMPSYAFQSETDCGMFLSGTNSISFSTNGTTRLTIGANGQHTITSNGSLAPSAQIINNNNTFSNAVTYINLSNGSNNINARLLTLANRGVSVFSVDPLANTTIASLSGAADSFISVTNTGLLQKSGYTTTSINSRLVTLESNINNISVSSTTLNSSSNLKIYTNYGATSNIQFTYDTSININHSNKFLTVNTNKIRVNIPATYSILYNGSTYTSYIETATSGNCIELRYVGNNTFVVECAVGNLTGA
jgi:hypothetical protein